MQLAHPLVAKALLLEECDRSVGLSLDELGDLDLRITGAAELAEGHGDVLAGDSVLRRQGQRRCEGYGATTSRVGSRCAVVVPAPRMMSCTGTPSTIIRIEAGSRSWQARRVGVVAKLRRIMAYYPPAMDRVDLMLIEVLKHPPQRTAALYGSSTSRLR